MASKKYTMILALLGLLQTATFAQSNNANADWAMDSSKVSTKMMPQHNEFMNNQYPYPTKPRSQWELGFAGGLSFLFSDIDPRLGFGGGISLRKSLGHTISVRGSYNGSINYGLDYRLRGRGFEGGGNGAFKAFYTTQGRQYVANYRNQLHQLSVDFIASLNTASHYRGNPKSNIYILAGYTAISADVDVNALNGSSPYSFETITNYLGKRKDIKNDLKDALDDSYENNAPLVNGNRNNAGRLKDNQLLRHGLNIGAGIAFKLSDKVNIGLEQKFTIPFDDGFDGINIGRANDFLSATQLRLNLNIGKASTHVAPLWWINPNNFIYNEINIPKHMKIPIPVLPDADGDGIIDQFDQEPNTPAGAAVDSHGVARDSDGDGVPDYKDKELLTPQNCFPVNADGVGTCPEPPCCTEMRSRMDSLAAANACTLTGLPSVQFKSGSVKLSSAATASLTSAAQQINAGNNANCKIRVVGYGASDKRAQQLSWDRVNAVIRYLVEKQGISESRFIFTYGQEGDVNTVDIEGTTEEGPNTVPAPHPNLRRSR